MKGILPGLMKQAQEMQTNMKKAQEALASMEVTGDAGGGMVSLVMTGKHEVKQVKIDEEILTDREMLEDLVAAAFNNAVHKVAKASESQLSGMASGIDLPAGFKLPF